MANWFNKLTSAFRKNPYTTPTTSYLRSMITGSFYKISDIRGNNSVADILTQVKTMRAMSTDSQIDTALSYYATDATTPNSNNEIIWATATEDRYKEAADIINTKFKQWDINTYARDHILELALMGNLYIPTTLMYKDDVSDQKQHVVLNNNTVRDDEFEIITSYKIPPEDIVHLWRRGIPRGYIMEPADGFSTDMTILPEEAVIHFTLGGLLGDYTITGVDDNGNPADYDIQFGTPLMARAVQPTQTLSLLEDSVLLSSLCRVVKFINVECGNAEEEEAKKTLEMVKDMIEQKFSMNTATGDAQSYIDPQSPNNLIFLTKINGQDPISITDLNMADATEADNKLLEYYQNKKLSVLGVPKEAMNFSSSEGLGGAGAVMSQRSALYANSLMRLETAYKEGWRKAINTYFVQHGLSGYVDNYQLNMNPIITQMSTVAFEKRDAAIGQAQTLVDLLKNLGVENADTYKNAITEILIDALPGTSSEVASWNVDLTAGGEGNEF